MSRVIDISLPLSADLATWPGNPGFDLRAHKRIADGESSNVSALSMGTHTGTHIDAPYHFIDDGPTAERAPLEALVGDAFVADLRAVSGVIGPGDLEAASIPGEAERLLLRTRNSDAFAARPTRFPEAFVSLGVDAAAWVVERGVRAVGIDFLGIEARGSGGGAHRVLLGAGTWIIEGLDLSRAEPGPYRLVCLPLRLVGADGAPARAVLLADEARG